MEVEWKESSQKTIHMVGRKGKVKAPACMCVVDRIETSVSLQVELKCVDPSSGGYYYHDHLPLLGYMLHNRVVQLLAS